MKTALTYGIVACSKTRVRCIFCGVCIPKANKCIEQHTNGTKHKYTIDLMNENGISFVDDVLHCKPCNKTLDEGDSVSKHVEDDDHANWLAAMDDLTDGEFISLDGYLSCERDDASCEVCNTNIECSLLSIEEHVNHINHRTNVVSKLKPMNGIFSVDNDYEVWCKLCDTHIENDASSILGHIDDDENHTEWLAEIEDLIDGQDVSIDSYLANEHERYAYCNKCQVEVLCDAQNIENHVHSDSHLNQFFL